MISASHFTRDDPSKEIVDAGFKIHKTLGPGLLENVYEECLAFELIKRGLSVEKQKILPVIYEGHKIEIGYRLDLVINNNFIIEVKSTDKILPVYEAQILTYMRLSGIPVGFIMNFKTPLFKDGLKRFSLQKSS